MTLDFESDQFLKLLTDALRAGPGSPEWHEATTQLRNRGAAEADEFRLLCDARAHLESGREYRSIRAGPGFTRKLMTAIDGQTQRAPRRISLANLIGIGSALVALCVLAIVGYLMLSRAQPGAGSAEIERLSTTLLGNPVAAEAFDGELPDEWRTVGKLPLEFARGMHAEKSPGNGKDYVGGGVTWATPLVPDEPFAIETTFYLNRPSEDLLAQVAVTDQPDFSDDNATSSHELVWLLQSGTAKVIRPEGRLDAQAPANKDAHSELNLRITLDRDNAIFEMNGKRLWAGPNGLDPNKPRYIALRLLRRGLERHDQIVVKSVRILKEH